VISAFIARILGVIGNRLKIAERLLNFIKLVKGLIQGKLQGDKK
jgi:hypothetical protein